MRKLLAPLITALFIIPIALTIWAQNMERTYTEQVVRINTRLNISEIVYYANTLVPEVDPFTTVRSIYGTETAPNFVQVKSLSEPQSTQYLDVLDRTIVNLLGSPENLETMAETRLKEIQKVNLPDTAIPPLYKEYIDLRVQAQQVRTFLENRDNRFTVLSSEQIKSGIVFRALLLGLGIDMALILGYIWFTSEMKERRKNEKA